MDSLSRIEFSIGVLTLLAASIGIASPRKDSSHPLSDPRAMSQFVDERVVIDGHVIPRVWQGCCGSEQLCQGPDAWFKPRCHQLSNPMDENEVYKRVGANVSVVLHDKRHLKQQNAALTSPLLISNELDEDAMGTKHRYLYAEQLSLDAIKDRQSLARWSKSRYLIGVRMVRLTHSQALSENTFKGVISKKGIQTLLDRQFILDVGFLDKASRLAVIEIATKRGKPVIFSQAVRQNNHPCGGEDPMQVTSDEEVCALASNGGLLVVGPMKRLVGPADNQCVNLQKVHDYLVSQISAFRAVTCEGQSDQLNLLDHLALASALPVLPNLSSGEDNSTTQFSNWHLFADHYMIRGADAGTLSQLLGENYGRVLRKAMPGVQPAKPLFPVDGQSLTVDKSIQFQWTKPLTNNPKRMPGRVFGMRRHRLEIQQRSGIAYAPFLSRKVVMGDKKVVTLSEGYFRWRIVSMNRKYRATSNWAYFSMVGGKPQRSN